MVRYRFSEFTLSPQQRLLIRQGQVVPLIPRYFDLLLLLIERRTEAVHRREIFDRVWGDVIVSDSALSQAVRTIRNTLGDDSKEPRFIRTVSRHGYQFVFPELIEEQDDAASPPARPIAPAVTDETLEPGLRRAARIASRQWPRGSVGGALAGVAAGGLGGLILAAAPGSAATLAIVPVLAMIGGGCGAIGGAGVGAGLAFSEAATRSHRALALLAGAAIGGGIVGAAVEWLTRWSLGSLVGLDIDVGGGLEGVVIGAAAGLAFTIATVSTDDGVSIPRGGRRLRAALITAACCGMAGLALTLAGHPLAGGTIHAIATAAHGSRATLAPLGRLIGEPDFGPISGAILAFGEGGVFGLGLALGVLRRHRDE